MTQLKLNCTKKLVNNTDYKILDEVYIPNKGELDLYLNFNTVIDGSVYFKDYGPLGLNCLVVDSCTSLDSIKLNNDIRLQLDCSAAGCFSQFYDGSIAVVGNTSKTVMLSDLSQLYLNNYIFSNVDGKMFLIYNTEQTNNNLDILLNRVESRIKKISSWGTDIGAIVTLKYGDDHIVTVPNTANYMIDYNIRTNSKQTYGSLTTTTGTKFNYGTVIGDHLICFPYNYTKLIDVNLLTQTISEYGSFGATSKFSVMNLVSQFLLTDGRVLGIPRTLNYFTIYDPSNNGLTNYGTLTSTSGVNKFLGCEKINDTLYVLIPCDYNAVLNFNPVDGSINSYGTVQSITSKYETYQRVNDDLIVCIPRNANSVINIHPISKTTETYGNAFTGTNLYYQSILLSSGKILAVPHTGTQILLVDPVAKTTSLFGTFTGATTFKYMTKLIESSNGHVIAFPGNSNYILDIDPINQTYEAVKDLGGVAYKFYESYFYDDVIYKINNTQILGVPYGYANILDYNPVSRDLFKIGYFYKATPGGLKFVRTMINDGTNRLIFVNCTDYTSVLDIELR